MLRKLLRIASRVGAPGTILELGDAGGRILYLSAAMGPVSVVTGLERDDVEQLHEQLAVWLRDQDDREAPAPFARPVPAPRIAGMLGRLVDDAAAARTVQLRTDAAAWTP